MKSGHSDFTQNIGWQLRRLGDLCEFVRGPFGGSLKKSIFVDEGYAVYEQQHAIYNQFDEIRYFVDDVKFREMQRFELHPRDLIMSCSGTMGKVAIVPENIREGIINQALLKLTPMPAVLPEFLKYWMDSPDFQDSLCEQAGGAAIQNVASVSILKQIQIRLPPISEQKRIVSILDEAFEGIARAKANAEQNQANSKRLFESFLDARFNLESNDSKKVTLAHATGGISTGPFGSLLHKKDYVENGIPLVNPAHITDNGIEPDFRKSVSKETARRLSSYLLKAGDIVIGRRGEMGRCALVTEAENGWICGTGSFIIRSSPQCNAGYLVRLLRSNSCKQRLEEIAGGAVMPNLSNTDLGSFEIQLPTIKQQNLIVEEIDEMAIETDRLDNVYSRKLVTLDELKKSLLHKAFAGEL